MRGAESEPVVLLFEQGAAAIIAILGTLKAGKFYVPLDPGLPDERANEIIKDSTAKLVVTHTSTLDSVTRLAMESRPLLNIDALDSANHPCA
jgi:arthrofactin-type cyclic lipopeptide synthetase A